jgi:hypothetical protein
LAGPFAPCSDVTVSPPHELAVPTLAETHSYEYVAADRELEQRKGKSQRWTPHSFACGDRARIGSISKARSARWNCVGTGFSGSCLVKMLRRSL